MPNRVTRFFQQLQEDGEAARRVRERRSTDAAGHKSYDSFVHIQYNADKTIVGVDSFELPIPQRNEVVALRPWGGYVRMLVKRAEVTEPDDLIPTPLLFIEGQLIVE